MLLVLPVYDQDGKTYPLCPLCYNYPPFEGVAKVCSHLHLIDVTHLTA